MQSFLIHRALYRIFNPLVNGLVAYLLVLLVNNNVEQLAQYFLGTELYLLIFLAALLQEFTRLFLVTTQRVTRLGSALKVGLQILGTLFLTLLLINGFMLLYYQKILGFAPAREELIAFSGIFLVLNGVYLSLHLGHQSLQAHSERQIAQELRLKQETELNFKEFKRGLNPTLLLDSLETLIVLLRKQPARAEQLLNQLSKVYRYTLSSPKQQLVTLAQELEQLQQFIDLLNFLPLRQLELNTKIRLTADALIVPGCLLNITEQIARHSILSAQAPLTLSVEESANHWHFSYTPFEKIGAGLRLSHLKFIEQRYSYYSNVGLELKSSEGQKSILIPKIQAP